jgi:hypothetical protein
MRKDDKSVRIARNRARFEGGTSPLQVQDLTAAVTLSVSIMII